MRTFFASAAGSLAIAVAAAACTQGDISAPVSGETEAIPAAPTSPFTPPVGDPPTGPADDSPGAPATDAGTADPGDPPSKPPAAKDGLLIAYWASWTRSTLPVSSIPWDRVTHVAHSFVLPATTGGLKNAATYVDASLVKAAHAHGAKVVASVGGWGAKFDANVDPVLRAKTVSALAALCRDHGYDGIDVDWEYPTASTAAAWASLILELRAALDAIDPALTLSAAISATPEHMKVLPKNALEAMDWIGVMTYDYAGSWSSRIAHGAPLFADGGAPSTARSIAYLVDTMGVTESKVLVGLPFYGYRFAGSSLGGTPVDPCDGVDYRAIAPLVGNDGYVRRFDDVAKTPFLTRPTSPGFVSYDDAASIAGKCTWAKDRGLGGAIVWHLAGDRMGDGTHPLLAAAQACR